MRARWFSIFNKSCTIKRNQKFQEWLVVCFRRQMRTFSENEKQRYRINTHRLIGVERGIGLSTCQLLFCNCGDKDSFTC